MEERKLNKLTNTILVFFSLLFIVSLVVFLSAKKETNIELYSFSDPIINNALYTDNKLVNGRLRYYNGNTFLEYNPDNRQITKLTTQSLLNNIFVTNWLNSGAIFKLGQSALDKDFFIKKADEFNQSKIDPSLGGEDNEADNETNPENIYWFISFKDSSIKPISDFTESTKLGYLLENGDYVYPTHLKFPPDAWFFSTIKPDGEIAKDTYASPKSEGQIRLIHLDENTARYLKQKNGKISIIEHDRKADQRRTLVEDLYGNNNQETITSNVVTDGKTAISIINSRDDKFYLEKINITDGSRTKITDTPKESILIPGENLQTNKLFKYGEGNTRIVFYDFLGNNLGETLNIPVSYNIENIIPYKDLFLIANKLEIFTMSRNKNHLSQIRKPYDGPLEDKFKNTGLTIERDIFDTTGNKNSYILTVPDGKLSDIYKKFTSELEKQNLDINLFTITPILGRQAEDDML